MAGGISEVRVVGDEVEEVLQGSGWSSGSRCGVNLPPCGYLAGLEPFLL